MIHIKKGDPPEFLASYIKKNPKSTYESRGFKSYYTELRKNLIREQKGLCAYCCSRISLESSHNEHIEPRHGKNGSTSLRSLDYCNIVASCNSVNSCGKKKGNEYDEKRFISPLQEDCESKFSYDPDGFMKGDEYTISLLNLNSYSLMRARRAVYKSILNMSKEDIQMIYCIDEDTYQPYSNVIFWFLNTDLTY